MHISVRMNFPAQSSSVNLELVAQYGSKVLNPTKYLCVSFLSGPFSLTQSTANKTRIINQLVREKSCQRRKPSRDIQNGHPYFYLQVRTVEHIPQYIRIWTYTYYLTQKASS